MKATRLLIVALFMGALAIGATSCEDEKDTTLYPYTLDMSLVDAGDLSANQKSFLELTMALTVKEFGTLVLEKSVAEKTFNKAIPLCNLEIQKAIGKHSRNVVVKIELYNKLTRKVDFSSNLVLLPQ